MAQKRKKPVMKIAQDTREKRPYDFSKYPVEVLEMSLPFGDYSLCDPDLREILTIERKSIDDFTNCCGNDRPRFEREMIALRGYKYGYLVGEFSWQDVLTHSYRSQIHPHSVIGSVAKWQRWGIKFAFLENREVATYYVVSLLKNIAVAEIAIARAHCIQYSQDIEIPIPTGITDRNLDLIIP